MERLPPMRLQSHQHIEATHLITRLDLRREYRPHGLTINVPRGTLDANRRWHLARSKYENYESEAGLATFRERLPLLQAGGGIGVVAAYLNRCLLPREHRVFEGCAEIVPTLIGNMVRNDCERFLVKHALLCNCGDHPEGGGLPWSPAWNANYASVVKRLTFKEATRGIEAPFNLLLDIEGCENAWLSDQDLDDVESIVIDADPVEPESPVDTARLLARLENLGFRHRYFRGNVHGLTRSA